VVEHIAVGVEDKVVVLEAHKVVVVEEGIAAGEGHTAAVEVVVAGHMVVVEAVCKLLVEEMGHNLVGNWWVGLAAAQAADDLVSIHISNNECYTTNIH